MLLGILGTHAVGKTTFVKSLHDNYHYRVLCADADKLYIPGKEVVNTRKYTHSTAADKTSFLDQFVADDTQLIIAEGCRFFAGSTMSGISNLYTTYNGGIKLFVIRTTPEVMLKCMEDRCIKRGKPFRREYWEGGNANYYAAAKFDNLIGKRAPNIPVKRFDFNGDYGFWQKEVLPEIVKLGDWYG